MRQALILAGGKGTRLKERLGDLPKPLIDMCGKPLLERQILLLKDFGFERILVLVNYKAEAITQFCAEHANWGLDITCIDDGEPRGTAGAVLHVFEQLDEHFLVMYGDTMMQVDLDRFELFHFAYADTEATLFLHPNDHPQDSDLVDVDDSGFVLGFHPYPHASGTWLPNLVNAALYCVRRDALLAWRDIPGQLDFGKDIFPAMILRGMKLRGYNSPEYIKDVGTPSRIDKVRADFTSGRIERAGLSYEQMAVFLDRDGTINREVDHLSSAENFELLPGVEQAIRRLNQAEYRVCVVTNQPVVARGECTHNELKLIHNKMETLLGHCGAYIDRIDYCPHHPEAGFPKELPELKIDCNCRKPATGLIDIAVESLNISRTRSWLIGDSTADMLAASRAGLRSILVETGYAGLDHKYLVTPDYTMPDLQSAVEFILRGHEQLLQILEPHANAVKKGSVVFIGGQSRCGKSTVASGFAELLKTAGHSCVVLSTDRWLLSDADRGQGGVLERHDVQALRDFVQRISRRLDDLDEEIPAYAKARRQQFPRAQQLCIRNSDTVIIEGVVALYFASLIQSTCRFMVDCEESLRHARVIREYELRGESLRAEEIYKKRMGDEWPWVHEIMASAQPVRIHI